MRDALRKNTLSRDNYSCRHCESKINLEVHHIIAKEECDLLGLGQELVKHLERPEFCITLCKDCHTTTYISSATKHLYTEAEKKELQDIDRKIREASKRYDDLKNRYRNLWNTSSYKAQKDGIKKYIKELENRKMELINMGKKRMDKRRIEVNKLCDKHLLKISKNID
ncbi:MAG: hypothetical protein PHQ86_07565 [Dehalococcoidales bacterium]|nr:hypothetical protein [Dehalococcoidales bacterium]